MSKVSIKPRAMIFPLPTAVVGANIDGKANFNTLGNCGIIAMDPPTIYISSHGSHYNNEGIKDNQTFSVNIPSAYHVVSADYVGIVSGRDADKSEVFDVFYGELETAPMVREYPINLECKVIKSLNIHGMDVFIAEVVGTYIASECIEVGNVHTERINPLIYGFDNKYYSFGQVVGKGFSSGKEYKN